MKLQFCGAAKTVTGSCYYIDAGSFKFLVDCGAFQGERELEKFNKEPFSFDPASIDIVFLTHAHFDHCGRLPMLVKQGFKGRIISTQPTRDLTKIVLLDSANLQKEEYERWIARNERKGEEGDSESRKPLYTEEDVEETMKFFEVYPYGDSVDLHNGCEFRMRDAGHILGSSIFEFWLKTETDRPRKIVFSGDLGQPGARIIRDPDMIREADYVIVESTYGDRLHKDKDETTLEFLTILKEVQKSQGNILIPSFAIERTQEILYELNLFTENRLLEGLPVYLDSPMAKKATEIFRQYPSFYDEDARRLLDKGDDPFNFPGFHEVESADESKRLIEKRGVVIIAGSGMCTGGRILHHIKNNIASPKTHMIFVGYQVEGTLGRQIVDGATTIKVFGEEMEVNAKIDTLGGFSAHGDQRDLRYWLRSFGHSPRTIFVTHGEEEVAYEFAGNIQQELKIDTTVPSMGEIFELK
jgi:metallo-beta-lactamase family protein